MDGATEHTLECHGNFNWLHPKIIARETSYRKRKMGQPLNTKKAKLDKNIKTIKLRRWKLMEFSLHEDDNN